jgi:hypothetical protein
MVYEESVCYSVSYYYGLAGFVRSRREEGEKREKWEKAVHIRDSPTQPG